MKYYRLKTGRTLGVGTLFHFHDKCRNSKKCKCSYAIMKKMCLFEKSAVKGKKYNYINLPVLTIY